MIKEYLKNVHNKPLKHRKRLTYGASAVITLMIAFVWLTSFSYFNSPSTENNDISSNNSLAVEDTNGPFTFFGSNISNAYDAFRSAIGVKVATKSKLNKNTKATLVYVPD